MKAMDGHIIGKAVYIALFAVNWNGALAASANVIEMRFRSDAMERVALGELVSVEFRVPLWSRRI